MAEYAGNEGYEEVYNMIDGVLKYKSGNYDTLVELTRAYKEAYSQEPNYNENRYREAYLYLYSPMFSFATSKILNEFEDYLKPQLEVKDKEALNVCCVGGGPATELLVLIKVLERLGIRPSSVNCTVLDKYTAWQETWEELVRGHKLGIDVSMTYVECDLSQDISKEARSAIQGADVVTVFMTYSRSAAAASILSHMKPKSTLLYMDNTCFDFPGKKTMKDRFLEELPEGFDVLSVEDKCCDSRDGRKFQDYPGMKSYWRDTVRSADEYHQKADIAVSALILTKQATTDDQDSKPPTDEDIQ